MQYHNNVTKQIHNILTYFYEKYLFSYHVYFP